MASQRKHHLPIHVDDDVLEKNPKFSQLLRILSGKLTPDGVTMHTKREKEMAEKNVSLAHHGWLMKHIPYYELRELITDLEMKSMEGALSLDQEQLTEVLSQTVAFSELGDYLPLPSGPSRNPTLMGLSSDDLDRHNHTKQHLPVVQKAVLPMLEERLMKKHKDLQEFFTPQKDFESRFEKQSVLSLPSLVEEKKQQLIRDKAALKTLKETKRESFLSYYQTLIQCLSSVERLIRHHKLHVHSVKIQITMNWMEALCVATCTRVKLMRLQLDYDTYNPRTVSALKVIRGHLDKSIADAERELSKTTQQVGLYRAVGSEFKTLVDQYTAIKKEVDNCGWCLERFEKSKQGKH